MIFKIHSFIDVITNSSTEIFNYCSGSVEPAKLLLNEIIKVFGYDGDYTKYFYVYATIDGWDVNTGPIAYEEGYINYIHDNLYCLYDDYSHFNEDSGLEYRATSDINFIFCVSNWDETLQRLHKDLRKVKLGLIEKPEWMEVVENLIINEDEDPRSINLAIEAKDKKFEPLCKKLKQFLYSIDKNTVQM